MTKRIGSIVYATSQGLGILARDFFEHDVINTVVIHEHHCRENHYGWYPYDTPIVSSRTRVYREARDWVKTLDTFLVFETPFDWELIRIAKENNVKVVFMPMHECTPQRLPYAPDVWLCPSLLDYQIFGGVYLPIPVPDRIRWRLRERAMTFVHNAGHGGLKGRNGTKELMDAIQYIKSPASLIIRSQEQLPEIKNKPKHVNVDVQIGTVEADRLWDTGDVFVFPEKFNGLSLPIQEAYASGMLVMATDRFPNDRYLPRLPLIAVDRFQTNQVGPGYRQFNEAVIDPVSIANEIDLWYGQDISDYSARGRVWAEANSWSILKNQYLGVLS